MPEFRYFARTPAGDVRTGQRRAASVDTLRAELAAEGAELYQWTLLPPGSATLPPADADAGPPSEPLFAAEDDAGAAEGAAPRATRLQLDDFVDSVRLIQRRRLPLELTLRMLQEESLSPRHRALIAQLTNRLEQGHDLSTVLKETGDWTTPELAPMVRAGEASGRLSELLDEFAQARRRRATYRWRTVYSIVYPSFLVLWAGSIGLLFLWVTIPSFRSIFTGFGTNLPALTRFILDSSDFVFSPWGGPTLLAAAALAAAAAWGLPRLLGGPLGPRRAWQSVPFLGRPFYHLAIAAFCRSLGTLVRAGHPLPESLRAAAAVSDEPLLREACERWARQVERGFDSGEAERTSAYLPKALTRVFRHDATDEERADSLDLIAENHDARGLSQVGMTVQFIEPPVLITLGLGCVVLVFGMFMPLVTLLNDLS